EARPVTCVPLLVVYTAVGPMHGNSQRCSLDDLTTEETQPACPTLDSTAILDLRDDARPMSACLAKRFLSRLNGPPVATRAHDKERSGPVFAELDDRDLVFIPPPEQAHAVNNGPPNFDQARAGGHASSFADSSSP